MLTPTGWCFLFDIIHSVEREVLCKRQVLFTLFFLYNGMIDYWLSTSPSVQAGSHGYL